MSALGPAGCVGFVPPFVRVRIVALDANGGADILAP